LSIAVARLAKFKAAGHDVNKILDKSTFEGWQGLWPPGQRDAQSNGQVEPGLPYFATESPCRNL
jgi:hypothetical protein